MGCVAAFLGCTKGIAYVSEYFLSFSQSDSILFFKIKMFVFGDVAHQQRLAQQA